MDTGFATGRKFGARGTPSAVLIDAKGHIASKVAAGGRTWDVTGTTTRAPKVLQRAGLEWAWRLGQEPRRMWKRYLVGNSKFVWLTAREAVKGRRG